MGCFSSTCSAFLGIQLRCDLSAPQVGCELCFCGNFAACLSLFLNTAL